MHFRQLSTPARGPSALRFASTLLVLWGVAGCISAPAQMDRPIAVPVDSRTGLPAPDPSLQVVTQEQIELTGQTNLGAALQQLVPAMQTSGHAVH